MKRQSIAYDLKRNFLENTIDYCRRRLAVGLIFQDDRFYFDVEPVLIQQAVDWMTLHGYGYNII